MAGHDDLEELYANTYTEEDRLAFENQPVSPKKFLVAWILALCLGPIGAQRYYLGLIPTAITKTVLFGAGAVLLGMEVTYAGLVLLCAVGAWTIIDLFLLLSGAMRDTNDHRLNGYSKFSGICAALTVLVVVGLLISGLIIGTSSAVTP